MHLLISLLLLISKSVDQHLQLCVYVCVHNDNGHSMFMNTVPVD